MNNINRIQIIDISNICIIYLSILRKFKIYKNLGKLALRLLKSKIQYHLKKIQAKKYNNYSKVNHLKHLIRLSLSLIKRVKKKNRICTKEVILKIIFMTKKHRIKLIQMQMIPSPGLHFIKQTTQLIQWIIQFWSQKLQ